MSRTKLTSLIAQLGIIPGAYSTPLGILFPHGCSRRYLPAPLAMGRHAKAGQRPFYLDRPAVDGLPAGADSHAATVTRAAGRPAARRERRWKEEPMAGTAIRPELVLRSLDATWNADRWGTLGDDGNRYEVIDGVLYRTTAPSPCHQWLSRQ